MAHTVADAGIGLIEVTWGSDRPAELVARLRAELSDCWIGAGTLLDTADVNQAIAAGAQFLFMPHTDPRLVELGIAQNTPVIPGALSPTEVVTAWQAGAACVKVFPVQAIGGPDYIRSLQAPLGGIPLIPTGGINLGNAIDFLKAGAIAVGLSTALFPREMIQQQDWKTIGHRARQLAASLQGYRQ